MIAGLRGALVALAIVAIANVVLLPLVLRDQRHRLSDDWRAPVVGWSREDLARYTRLVYRFVLPVLFAFVGFSAAKEVFGE